MEAAILTEGRREAAKSNHEAGHRLDVAEVAIGSVHSRKCSVRSLNQDSSSLSFVSKRRGRFIELRNRSFVNSLSENFVRLSAFLDNRSRNFVSPRDRREGRSEY